MNIVLGVTGGIAAYKAVALARLLVGTGHEVHVVPTESALRFVGAPTWEAISRNVVTTSVHEDVPEVRHVAIGQRADLVVIAPATANTLARMAAGIADDLLGTTLLATRAPVLVAPAMHTEMWQHPATQDNVAILRARGVQLIGPESGKLTGDDTGTGRMSEPEEIAARVEQMLGGAVEAPEDFAASDAEMSPVVDPLPEPHQSFDPAAGHPGDFEGVRLLVTAGGTREPIDPVRFIGNRSTGRQGVAIAAAAADRGAKVVLLAANIDEAVLADLAERPGVRIVPVETADELENAARAAAPGAEVVVMAAAVSDYHVVDVANHKIRKEDRPGEAPTIALAENPDILVGLVNDRRPGQVIVGFAAETVESEQELLDRGRRKAARKGVDLLAVNAVGWNEGFGAEENTLHLLDTDGNALGVVLGSKREAADGLLNAIVEVLEGAPRPLI